MGELDSLDSLCCRRCKLTGMLGPRLSWQSSPPSGTGMWNARVVATAGGVGSPAVIAPRGQPNQRDALVGIIAAQHPLKCSGQSVQRGLSARRAPVNRSRAQLSTTVTRGQQSQSGARQSRESTVRRSRAAGSRLGAPQESTAKRVISHAAQPVTTARREARLLLRATPVTPHHASHSPLKFARSIFTPH